MDVRNCKTCGRLFNYMGGAPLCPECKAALEKKFEDVSPNEKRLDLCRDYGLIYYYRTGEKRKEEVNK